MATDTQSTSRREWLICLALIGVYLVARLPNLRTMPAFTDETTYARWAQLIITDPRHNLFVSMSDAKPPLHYWLLAATRGFAGDPIKAGRILSVLLGVLVFPGLLALSREIARIAKGVNAGLLAFIAGMLLIASPIIAQQQRMIMAEALLLPQAVAMAWLSLRLARLLAENAAGRRVLLNALWLGVIWAAALLTKQVFSYFLWAFVPLAVVIYCRRDSWVRVVRQSLMPIAMMTLLGLACFLPVIFTDSTQTLKARLLYKPIFLPKSDDNRFTLAWNHILELFWPQADGRFHPWPHNAAAPLDHGILYLYLTPPILVLIAAAFVWMVRRRAWGLAIFLGGWTGIFLGSFLFGAGVIMSRYAALAALPLLLAAAWLLTLAAQWLREKLSLIPAAALATAFCAAFAAWPAAATGAAVISWQSPVYTAFDAEQYVTEFGGGQVTEQTLVWLMEQAEDHPITVVTGSWVGSPNDAMWLYLSGNPNIQLYWDDYKKTLVHPVAPGTYLLGENRWVDKADKRVVLDFSRPVYYIVPI
ncbi:MAG TPA: hypothetical protein VHM90_00440, partial [Phycisphaerae bacterium]|nr:hypothetical protein [Phycisphaerae bacterium]